MPHDEYDHLRDSSDAGESLRTEVCEHGTPAAAECLECGDRWYPAVPAPTLRDSSDAGESLRTTPHEAESEKEWYEWEHARTQQRRMRAIKQGIGCLLLIAIALVLWLGLVNAVDLVESWL